MCSAWAYKVTKDLCKRGMEVELCDYGAGTGLIGLVALAAGENVRVKGVEVDHMAIVAGRKNGELNGWSRAQFEMYAPPFGAAGGELWERLTGVDAIDPIKENVERYEEENGAADIVVANILAGPLKEVRIDSREWFSHNTTNYMAYPSWHPRFGHSQRTGGGSGFQGSSQRVRRRG